MLWHAKFLQVIKVPLTTYSGTVRETALACELDAETGLDPGPDQFGQGTLGSSELLSSFQADTASGLTNIASITPRVPRRNEGPVILRTQLKPPSDKPQEPRVCIKTQGDHAYEAWANAAEKR